MSGFLARMAKEYGSFPWLWFSSLFLLLTVPFLAPPLRKEKVWWHVAWAFLVLFVFSLFRSAAHGFTGGDALMLASWVAFGIGYSLLALRKDRRAWSGWLCLGVFAYLFMSICVRGLSR